MIRTLCLWLLLVGTATLVAACCGSVSCDCQDGNADAVAFRFDVDSLKKGFYSADIDSVYIRRIPRDTTLRPRADSVLLVRPRRLARRPLVLNNTLPLAAIGTRKLSQYRYSIRLASKARPPFRRYLIDSVQLAGNFQGDGCCTCYRNTRKMVYFNGRAYNQTSPGQDTVVLSR